MKDFCVVVHTCDKYAFCWEGFYKSFKKYNKVPKDIPIYFCTENRGNPFKEFTELRTGKGPWGQRLKQILGRIPEENVFYLQEDMWLTEERILKDYFKTFVTYSMDNFKLTPMSKEYSVKKFADVYRFLPESKYLVSPQPSFWKKDFFNSLIRDLENPWENELQGSLRVPSNARIFIDPSIGQWYQLVCSRGIINQIGKDIINRLKKG